jgi:molybdopterin biosynthesis enzyme
MKGFSELVTVSESLRKLLDGLPARTLKAEKCVLADALGRVFAENAKCPYDLPRFDRSAVDGYALEAMSTVGASPTNPVEFRVVGKIVAGDRPSKLVKVMDQEAVVIFTGAPMPEGGSENSEGI